MKAESFAMTKYNNSNDMHASNVAGTGNGIKQEYANYPQQSQPVAYGYNNNNNHNNNDNNLSQQHGNVASGHTPHQTLQQFFNRFNAVGSDAIVGGGHSACNFASSLSHSAGPEPGGKQHSLTSSSPVYTTDYDDEDSSLSSEEHVLAPLVCASAQSSRPCLTWACKACKKKSVTVDRRKAATMRERRRLRKVRTRHGLKGIQWVPELGRGFIFLGQTQQRFKRFKYSAVNHEYLKEIYVCYMNGYIT